MEWELIVSALQMAATSRRSGEGVSQPRRAACCCTWRTLYGSRACALKQLPYVSRYLTFNRVARLHARPGTPPRCAGPQLVQGSGWRPLGLHAQLCLAGGAKLPAGCGDWP
jgi:hypothetical protein